MAEALRNLQIFRNGAVITGKTVADIKSQIASAIAGGSLKVNDGEPVSIRYIEKDDTTNTVKGLYGVGYGTGTTATILWNDSILTIETSPLAGEYVTLHHTEDENGNVQLTVASHTSTLEAAGTTVYINKYDGTEITVEAYNALSDTEKAKYGASKADGLATAQNVKDYVDAKYIGSNAIDVTENTDDKNVISLKLSSHADNIIHIAEDGIWAVQGASTTITDVQVKENNGTETLYYTIDSNNKIIDGTVESSPVVAVEPNKRVIIIATSDSKLNSSILPETSEKFTERGELMTIEEGGKTKTVIRFYYNVGGNYYDVDVTALVNTSHTKVEGETAIEGGNTEYVAVSASTDETTNTVTLSSTLKTQAVATAVATTADGLATAVDVKKYVDDNETQVKGENDTDFNNTDYVNVSATRSGNTVTLSSSIKTAEMETAETEDGIATVKDVKEYVDGIAHTTVSAADETITVTETEVEGHKNFAINAEQSVINNNADDTMTVAKEGVLNQATLTKIETYIDNYDCGTFDLNTTTANDAASLNEAMSATSEATTVELNNDTTVAAGTTVTSY